MKSITRIAILILLLFCMVLSGGVVQAESGEKHYIIYDEYGEYLLEKTDVFVGDYYITSDYKKYEIISLNDNTNTGIAKYLYTVQKPKVDINKNAVTINTTDKVICLYMTHNDESYVPTDGTESVYGKGGIHDVAKKFASDLQNKGIDTYIDETLHIPHDTYAYQRSSVTSKGLLDKYSPNAIFDIHRDGTSRAYYINKDSGKERSMVRIVVGKGNPNMNINEEFAIYLLAVADEIEPGLFKDIYYAKGHYNQAQYSKSLLFEMGSHMVEKELVLESTERLANVVNTALFATTVDDETGDLTINDIPSISAPTIDTLLDSKNEEAINSSNTNVLIRLLVWSILIGGTIWLVFKLCKKKSK